MSLWGKITGGLKAIASAPLKLLSGAVKLPMESIKALGGTAAQVIGAAGQTARQVLPGLTQLAASSAPIVGSVIGGPLGGAIGGMVSKLVPQIGSLGDLSQAIIGAANQAIDPQTMVLSTARQIASGALPSSLPVTG